MALTMGEQDVSPAGNKKETCKKIFKVEKRINALNKKIAKSYETRANLLLTLNRILENEKHDTAYR